MSLKLLGLIYMGTEDPLCNIGLGVVLGCMLAPKYLFIITVIR
jgi:hypothetical protein